MPNTSSISSICALSNSDPLSVWNASISDIGKSRVANADFTSRASFLSLAPWPTISRLYRSTSKQIVAPFVADPHVGQIRADMRAGFVSVEDPVHHVGKRRFVYRCPLCALGARVAPYAGKVVGLQDLADAPARGDLSAPSKHRPYTARPVTATVLMKDGNHLVFERVQLRFGIFALDHVIIGRTSHAQDFALR